MTRNELTEHLLGREIQYRFVSIAEAEALYTQLTDGLGQCDLKLLEVALQVPMHEALNNESAGVHELAEVMMAAIITYRQLIDHYPPTQVTTEIHRC